MERLIISTIGWIYIAAWSVGFYGQIYTNYKHKSVQGMSKDFIAMNITSFIFYATYTTYGYFINSQQTGQVDLNDIVLSYHALFATLIMIIQSIIYPHKITKISSKTRILLTSMWAFSIIHGLCTMKYKLYEVDPKYGCISIMGYFMLLISTIKFIPQVHLNYTRKSTHGWSIMMTIMDFIGGIFSISQILLQKYFHKETQLNIVKIMLGILVLTYDTIFLIQRFLLYPQSLEKKIN